MKIISFAETTPALLAGRKTVTRREWAERHARMFAATELVQAWDKSPRAGGRRVATIRLTEAPYREPARDIRPSDYEAEGFAYLDEQGLTLFGGMQPGEVYNRWKAMPPEHLLWVVRFELVAVLR